MTTVSVVIPTWNRSALLEQAIRSALSQTFPPLEILVCDDGSTDDSEQVASSINDPRVIWVSGEHSGLPAVPRNRGIALASGVWLAFLDSDDRWLPDKLSQQFTRAEQLSCDAVCCDAFRLLPGQNTPPMPLIGFTEERLTFADLLTVNRVICSSVLVKTDLIRNAGGFSKSRELVVGEDYALWLRVAVSSDFGVVGSPQLYYYDDPSQSIRKESGDAAAQYRAVLTDFCSWAGARQYPELRGFALERLENIGSTNVGLVHQLFRRASQLIRKGSST